MLSKFDIFIAGFLLVGILRAIWLEIKAPQRPCVANGSTIIQGNDSESETKPLKYTRSSSGTAEIIGYIIFGPLAVIFAICSFLAPIAVVLIAIKLLF